MSLTTPRLTGEHLSPARKAALLKVLKQHHEQRRYNGAKIRKIMVVLDAEHFRFSDPTLDPALAKGLWLARQHQAQLELVHVMAGITSLPGQKNEVSLWTRRLERLAQHWPDLEVSARAIVALNKSSTIARLAQTVSADLIVARNEAQPFRVGVSPHWQWRLLREARTPLLFVIDPQPWPTPGEFVVSVGSSDSHRAILPVDFDAVAYGRTLAAPAQHRIRCVNVHSGPGKTPSIQHLSRFAQDMGLAVKQMTLLRGKRVPTLLEIGKSPRVALSIVGASRMSHLKRLWKRPLLRPLLASTQVDLLIVPEADTGERIDRAADLPLDGKGNRQEFVDDDIRSAA